jgi:hypothetical protein
MLVRRWSIACILATLYVAFWHLVNFRVRWVAYVSPMAEIVWMAAATMTFTVGLGLIAALVLRLHNRRLRDKIIGSVLLSIAPSVISLLVLYGILEGRNTLSRAAGRMLAEFPLRLFFFALLTFAGLMLVSALAHLRRRGRKADDTRTDTMP